jgi:type IV secretory pathway VirD2 relaxase
MKAKKMQKIEKHLEMIEERLANAQEYLAQNVNVEGSSFLHFDDWRGKSGHPSWTRNFMIPTMMKRRARKERALKNIDNKTKDKNLTSRKRYRGNES